MNAGVDNAIKMCAMFNAEKYSRARLTINWNYDGQIQVEVSPYNGEYIEHPTSTYNFASDGTYSKLSHN